MPAPADQFADFADAPKQDDYSDFADAPAQHQATNYDPSDGVSSGERFAAGVGKGVVDTGRGVYQLGASIGHAAGLVSDEKMKQIQEDIDESRRLDEPLMHTTAGKIGDIAGEALPALALGPTGIVSGALTGAALGAAQPVATGESRGQNATAGLIGGGVGGVAGKVLGGVLGGFGGQGSRAAAVKLLTDEGIPTSVAQKTGSKFAAHIERASAMTGDDAQEFAANQGAKFNGAVLKRMGVNKATAATPDVLGPADARIRGVMDGVAARTKVKVDNQLLNDMITAEHDAARTLPESQVKPIRTNIDDMLANASYNGGHLDGTFYQKLNTNLAALSKNSDYQPVIGDLQDAIHAALQRSANPADVRALVTARRQYRAMKQIENAVDPATGHISVPKLLTSMNAKTYGGRNQVLYGKGDQDLVKLAKAARQVIPDNLGNSGTAERSIPILGAMETLGSGDPVAAGTKLAVGALGANAIGKAMRSQGVASKYLVSGMGPPGRAVAPLVRETVPSASAAATIIGKQKIPPPPEEDQDQIERASGGKVDLDSLVNRLMSRWKSAKRETDESTKPLLKVPDATITRALEIAKAHII